MSVQLKTIVSGSTSSVLSFLKRISQQYSGKDYTKFFALSSNVPRDDIQGILFALTNRRNGGDVVGCLSRSVGQSDRTQYFSCSLAIFASEDAVAFRSTIPGREPPQVGRWHSFRTKDDIPDKHSGSFGFGEGVSWADVWSQNGASYPLPEGLRDMSDPDDVQAIIYTTDLAPDGLSKSLDAFKGATKLGLIATSTPFITGRPVTLFHNDRIYSSGAVGLALKKQYNVASRVEYLGAHSLSNKMTVTSCEGNMVHNIDHRAATELLLSAIARQGLGQSFSQDLKGEDIFSLAVIAPQGGIADLYRITAGDPSRGSISLASQTAPSVGSVVQFFYHPKPKRNSTVLCQLQQKLESSSLQTLRFTTLPESEERAASGKRRDGSEEDIILQDTFIAASENGFIRGKHNETSQTSSIPGGSVSLEWATSQ